MPKKVKYYGVWDVKLERWCFRGGYNIYSHRWGIYPDLFVLDNLVVLSPIGVWKNKEVIEKKLPFNEIHKYGWDWKVKEFTPLDALKERMKTCLRK